MGRTIAHTEASLGWGGQEIRIFEEMRAMRDRGHTMLLVARPQSTIYRKAQDGGFTVRVMSSNRLKYPLSILRLARYFKKHQVDVVNTHSSRDGYIAGIAARLARVPLIIRTRHIDVEYPNKFFSRLAFKHLPHCVTTTSNRIVENLTRELDLDPKQVSCIPTGIDLERYQSPGSVASDLRRKFLGSEGQLLIGMISVLRSWKGHQTLLEAIAMMAGELQNAHFIIAGEGPQRSAIESRIAALKLGNRVTLVGHRDDVPTLLAALDLLVLPSYAHEGIPQIILQAQAAGTPVIGTTAGGIPEVIQNGHTGLLIEPLKPEILARSILDLARDETLRSTLSQQAKEFAQQHHSLERMCQSTESVYRQYLR